MAHPLILIMARQMQKILFASHPILKRRAIIISMLYVAKFPGSFARMNLLINNGKQEKNVAINMDDVVVKGQVRASGDQ